MSRINPDNYDSQKELDKAHRKRARKRRKKNRGTYYGKEIETEDNVQYGSGGRK